MEFTEAESNLNDLISEYEGATQTYGAWEEEEEEEE